MFRLAAKYLTTKPASTTQNSELKTLFSLWLRLVNMEVISLARGCGLLAVDYKLSDLRNN